MHRTMSTALMAFLFASNIVAAVADETECRVLDPTSTPLNVRTAPSGRIILRQSPKRHGRICYRSCSRPHRKILGLYIQAFRWKANWMGVPSFYILHRLAFANATNGPVIVPVGPRADFYLRSAPWTVSPNISNICR